MTSSDKLWVDVMCESFAGPEHLLAGLKLSRTLFPVG